MPIFTPAHLQMLAFERSLDAAQCAEKLAILRKLTQRIDDGTLPGLAETRAEQSFNERLFSEVFGYRTLLLNGVDDYHLLPKGSAVVGATRNYDDFSLGFFGASRMQRLVHAELKPYGTDLDRKQRSGRHRNKTPVEQAMEAGRRGRDIEWIIVSNFDEVRLYHRDDSMSHETVTLSDIVSNTDVRRAYALLGLETLIGAEGTASPLTVMRRGGHPVQLPRQSGYVRLIHEARATVALEEASLPAMDQAFRAAMAQAINDGWNWPTSSPQDPEYSDDRLLVEHQVYTPTPLPLRLEYNRNGVVRLQELLHTHHPSGVSPPVLVPEEVVARKMSMFLVLAARMICPVFPSGLAVRWSILDGHSEQLVVIRRNGQPGLRSESDYVVTKEFAPDAFNPTAATRAHIAVYLAKAIKDLLFSWCYRPGRGRIERLDWSESDSEAVLQSIGV